MLSGAQQLARNPETGRSDNTPAASPMVSPLLNIILVDLSNNLWSGN
jgi:hypothetical protein